MAAVTTRQAPVLPPPSGRAGFGGTLRSEFTKIRSVRSTYWTLLVLLAVSIGIGAAICAGTAANWDQTSAADRATFDATQVSIAGLFYLGQLVIVVFGAIVLTAEYSTGMIRTSLTAMPRRVTVYAAKALVFAVVALVVTLVADAMIRKDVETTSRARNHSSRKRRLFQERFHGRHQGQRRFVHRVMPGILQDRHRDLPVAAQIGALHQCAVEGGIVPAHQHLQPVLADDLIAEIGIRPCWKIGGKCCR